MNKAEKLYRAFFMPFMAFTLLYFDKYEFKRNELAIELASENTKANQKLMRDIYKRRSQIIINKNTNR